MVMQLDVAVAKAPKGLYKGLKGLTRPFKGLIRSP